MSSPRSASWRPITTSPSSAPSAWVRPFSRTPWAHIACRRGYSVLALRSDRMLKTLKHARLTQSHETELRKLVAVDLLLLDAFGLDAMDAQESRDAYEIFLARHRAGSIIV